jgi:hypothetical protein
MRRRRAPRPSCAGGPKDLHVYDPAARAWTDLSAALSGTPPSPRSGHGFTSAGGKLYVHGGARGSTNLTPVTAASNTAMVSQAVIHRFARPPSLRVVSCPVSRLASASSRSAATGIRPSIQPGKRPLTVIKGRHLREDDACAHARAQPIDRGSVSRCRCASPLACARLLLSSGSCAAHLP